MGKEVIIALDYQTLDRALEFLHKFDNQKLYVKVGMELYLNNGPVVIEKIKELGHSIFLDLKLHDIPNTVYGAVKGLTKLGVDMLNVHASGGFKMMGAAKQGIIDGGGKNTLLIAVTQLTSITESKAKSEQLISVSLEESVLNYAKLAKSAGLDGVVCSALESKMIEENLGEDFIRVTPGIRLVGAKKEDQRRVATPEIAKINGSTHIVVGRTITKAEDPVKVYNIIKQQFED